MVRGLPRQCQAKGWTKSKWERCLSNVSSGYNKYAVCNSQCLRSRRSRR